MQLKHIRVAITLTKIEVKAPRFKFFPQLWKSKRDLWGKAKNFKGWWNDLEFAFEVWKHQLRGLHGSPKRWGENDIVVPLRDFGPAIDTLLLADLIQLGIQVVVDQVLLEHLLGDETRLLFDRLHLLVEGRLAVAYERQFLQTIHFIVP